MSPLTAQQAQRARKSHILSGLSKVGMKHDLSVEGRGRARAGGSKLKKGEGKTGAAMVLAVCLEGLRPPCAHEPVSFRSA